MKHLQVDKIQKPSTRWPMFLSRWSVGVQQRSRPRMLPLHKCAHETQPQHDVERHFVDELSHVWRRLMLSGGGERVPKH